MTIQQIIYLLSISFQLSGALILIFFCWGNIERKVLNKVFPANSVMERNDDNKVVISRDKLFRAYKEVWLNRIAFILLGLGYLLSVFGSNEGINLWLGFILLIIGSVVIMMIGNKIATIIAKRVSTYDKEYEYEELCSKIDVEVSTNILPNEINELLKN